MFGVFEYLGERHNPGAVGDVDCQPPPLVRNRWLSLTGFMVASGILGAWLWLLGHSCFTAASDANALAWFLTGFVCTGMYLVLAFVFLPKADMSNLGWLGGMMDHPFRYSDDVNRAILFFRVALFPGRMLANALINPFRLDATVETEEKQELETEREVEARDAIVQDFLRRNGIHAIEHKTDLNNQR
ncbi:MAG TPA: hypothetical protein VM597_11900 [Gemmataceae bacterium]|nr:hypothetical protein [Gemmataceae bacterium]